MGLVDIGGCNRDGLVGWDGALRHVLSFLSYGEEDDKENILERPRTFTFTMKTK